MESMTMSTSIYAGIVVVVVVVVAGRYRCHRHRLRVSVWPNVQILLSDLRLIYQVIGIVSRVERTTPNAANTEDGHRSCRK